MPRSSSGRQVTFVEELEHFSEADCRLSDPLLVCSSEDFQKLCPYPAVVEMWEHRLHGRIGKLYREAFSEREQDAVARWQAQFRNWHLRSGAPDRIALRADTLRLLRRAADFFTMI